MECLFGLGRGSVPLRRRTEWALVLVTVASAHTGQPGVTPLCGYTCLTCLDGRLLTYTDTHGWCICHANIYYRGIGCGMFQRLADGRLRCWQGGAHIELGLRFNAHGCAEGLSALQCGELIA